MGPIPAVFRRWKLASQAGETLELVPQRADALPEPLPWVARRMVEHIRRLLPGVLRDLEAARAWNAPLQRCIRDLRRDHLLFQGDQLSGIVDFDAMGVDNVSADVARLLADWSPTIRSHCHGSLRVDSALVPPRT